MIVCWQSNGSFRLGRLLLAFHRKFPRARGDLVADSVISVGAVGDRRRGLAPFQPTWDLTVSRVLFTAVINISAYMRLLGGLSPARRQVQRQSPNAKSDAPQAEKIQEKSRDRADRLSRRRQDTLLNRILSGRTAKNTRHRQRIREIGIGQRPRRRRRRGSVRNEQRLHLLHVRAIWCASSTTDARKGKFDAIISRPPGSPTRRRWRRPSSSTRMSPQDQARCVVTVADANGSTTGSRTLRRQRTRSPSPT